MVAHQAVLLTPSKSVHLRRRVLCPQIAPVALCFPHLQRVRNLLIPHTLTFLCFHTLTNSFAIVKNTTPFLSCHSALFAKNTPGGGGSCLAVISLSEPRAPRIFPIPPLWPLCSRWHPC